MPAMQGCAVFCSLPETAGSGADVIELNFSCPNMEDNALGVTISQSEELIEKYTEARRGCTIPLLAKMTPNITDMVPMAAAARRCAGCHLCRLVCPTGAIGTVTKRVFKKPIHRE